MRSKTASAQKWSALAFLLDCAAFVAALLIVALLSGEPASFALNGLVTQNDAMVTASALLWIYAMGLYRPESLLASDLRLPLFVAFCLSTLFAGALSVVVGHSELMATRWVRILPTAFALILAYRSVFGRVATLNGNDLVLEKERRKVPLDEMQFLQANTSINPTRNMLSRGLKRLFDIVSCLILLVFTLPVSIGAILAILVSDGRPVFYRQERVGRDGRLFQLYKLRTMRVSAEADGVARWAQPNDDRVTRVGRFLRLSRIDEIPQFLNVILGDMSLVGPRPERPQIVALLEQSIPNYSCRHLVKPGITGWAQVNFPYGASVADAEEKTRHDFYYIKHGSLILDAIILLQTVRVILTADGSR